MIDNDRDISWKRLLRIQSNEKNGTYQNRRKMFFSLIKDPLFDQNDIADYASYLESLGGAVKYEVSDSSGNNGFIA